MFKYYKEDEGMIVDTNIGVVSQQIEMYFESPPYYDFSAVYETEN